MLKINKSYQSPNFTDEIIKPKYIILHCMCFDDKKSLEFLCAEENEVSAHFYIARDGEVFNLVADNKKAWHAGVSSWKEDTNLNINSIGIELGNVGTLGNESVYTDNQYSSLIQLLTYLKDKYNIQPQNILGHCHIAPDRKTDPGIKFNWQLLIDNNLAVDYQR